MDDELMTPLHIAARFGHTKMVKLLTRRNANPKIANINEETPQGLYIVWQGLSETCVRTNGYIVTDVYSLGMNNSRLVPDFRLFDV